MRTISPRPRGAHHRWALIAASVALHLGLLPLTPFAASSADAGPTLSGANIPLSRPPPAPTSPVAIERAAHGGDAQEGERIARDVRRGDCSICHQLPGYDPRDQGTLGPSLAGIGNRLTPEQLRERIENPLRVNPASVMPGYLVADGLQRVRVAKAGQTLLSAREIDDVVAYLTTLTDAPASDRGIP